MTRRTKRHETAPYAAGGLDMGSPPRHKGAVLTGRTAAYCAFFALGAAPLSCNPTGTTVRTTVAPGFDPQRHAVSVFGVFEDGRMSSSGWSVLAPRLAPALGARSCEIGYDVLGARSDEVGQAIDDFAREEGPSDELLAQVAPAAEGDLVMVFAVAQTASDATSFRLGSSSEPWAIENRGAGRMGGMPQPRRNDPRPELVTGEPAGDRLEISASLFSVHQGRSVARVTLECPAKGVDEAISKLALEIERSFPAIVCVGWKRDAPIDASRIRAAASAE